ncbi:endonuclease-reverse transcriptase [Plakobranchus ocellatus]|uniref:Endonuclease-reverse transcriptase n=1 Tax=Plakobranchus ocellatus TaxID=259542 RepID=A0AAV4B187_9GAST|nr:endonuclease-reverse transcriptase [Plakobranchus ocellatus]
MIKACGEEGIDVYHKLCKKIWEKGQWPTDWKRAIFIPLPKKGDLQLCSNYRTISLISHASKILLKIIMKRMERKLEEEVSNSQAGFRKNRALKMSSVRPKPSKKKAVIRPKWKKRNGCDLAGSPRIVLA